MFLGLVRFSYIIDVILAHASLFCASVVSLSRSAGHCRFIPSGKYDKSSFSRWGRAYILSPQGRMLLELNMLR